jgi:acetyl-CoA carboxylase carboxyl transferase subunit beta
MNWLTKNVLPKIRALGAKKETPDNLWRKCPSCGQMLFLRDLEAAQFVCTNCNHHMRIGPAARFRALFDDAKWEAIDLPDVPTDPLKFRDTKKYPDRLKEARAKTCTKDAIQAAVGALGSNKTVIAVQDFAFLGGSMGMATGEAVVAASLAAIEHRAPLILFTAAGGARMQEGILSLMQMPRTVIATQRLREANLPFIVVLTDPTTGGVTASYAMLGDIQIAEPGALIGFAGPRVIEQTIRETLPEGFQRSEYLLEHGMLDMVVHRHELRDTLARIVGLLTQPSVAPPKEENGEGKRKGRARPTELAPTEAIPHGSARPKRARN